MRTRGRGYSPFWFSVWAVIIIILVSLIALNSIQNRSYKAQSILKAPESLFTYWSWPLTGWRLHDADLAVISRPDFLLKDLDGQIAPKLWNLAMGCSSGSDVTLQSVRLTLPDAGALVLGLRTLFAELAFIKNKFHKYLCHNTYLTVENGKVIFENQSHSDILIKKFITKKIDSPVVQFEGIFKDRKPFGVTITYKPREDVAVFTSDFGRRAHFYGQIESFSSPKKSFLTGEVHYPASILTFGNPNSGSLSTMGTFSMNSELSGHLSDLVTKLWSAETLRIEGAVDAREGILKPFNLLAEVLREAGQIPTLTQLGALIEQKAFFKLFYAQETPFDLMRFIIRKEGRLIELSRIVMKHSTYLAAAEGSIDPATGNISFKGSLVLSDDLSRELIKNVPKLEILMSAGGRLSFPFLIVGSFHAPKAHADITQITDKIIAAYRTELIRRGNSRIEVLQ